MKLKHCFKRINLFPLNLLIFGGLCISCGITQKISYTGNTGYANYKMNITIHAEAMDGSLRGFMYFIPDTQICFRLFGPLGFKVGNGLITSSDFSFYNEIKDQPITDLKETFQNTTGCSLNLEVMQNLFLGKTDEFINSLTLINKEILDISVKKSGKFSSIGIKHKVSADCIFIDYKFKKNQLKSIKFTIINEKKVINAFIEISSISFGRKLCTFTK
jgi:hypothetical protein